MNTYSGQLLQKPQTAALQHPSYEMKTYIYIIFLATAVTFAALPTIGFCSSPEKTDKNLELLFYNANTPSQFIVVEKKHQKLSLFEHLDSVKLIKEFTCATGENPGTKKISGDARTPEGVYFITEVYEDKRITVFGSRAFHLNYPNIFDTHAGHRGDGIFIHGTNKKLIPNSTNGCITLDNKDLDELAPYLSVNSIPIIVLNSLPEALPGKDLRLVAQTPGFQDILNKFSSDLRNIPLHDIKSISYMKQGNQAIATIKFALYDGDLIQYRGQSRTYLTQSLTGSWRSLYTVQSQDQTPLLLAQRPAKNDLVAKAATLPPLASPPPPSQPLQLSKGEELLSFVEKWRKAWIAKDISTYINCYSPSFKSGSMDRDSWKAKKTYLNNRYAYITVSIKDIVVEWTESGANVSFFQTYKSDQYQTTGTKRLQLVNKNNRWMIESEYM